MPITFTEEDFQSAPAQPKAGFFSEQDFAPRVKKTPEQLLQVVNAAQAARDVVNPPETQGWLGQVAANPITQNVVSGLSLQPAMHAVGTVASIIPNIVANELYGSRSQPFVINRDTGELTQAPGVDPRFAAGKPMLNIPLAHPEQNGINDVSALPRVLAQMAEGMTTPENAALLPLAANKQVGSQIASTLFAPQMIAGGLQSAPQIVTGETPQAREEAAYNTALNLLLGAGIGKGLVDRYKAQPLVPEVMPPLQRPVAPTSRQLNAPALPFTDAEFATPKQLPAPGERPTMPVGSPLDRPAGSARFGVDPSGKAVDISQLSPKEQVELYRGPNQYVPREQYVRPAQQAPAIIGEQPKPKREVVFQNETQPIQPVYVPSKSPLEPSGGKVSFRAQAEAQGVPSARQSSLDLNRPQIDVPPTEFFVPREQKVLPPENSSYRAPKAAPTVEEYQRQQKRQNVEAGLTMEQPPMEPVAPEVGQYPEDIQSNRALSKLQRERLKLAVEQNKPVEVIRNILREGQEKNPPVAPPAKPMVAKMATSKNLNPLGDPMGTTYFGTPEDVSAYQGAQARLKSIRESDPTMDKPETFTQLQEVMKENERVKNKYGGMPPAEPLKEVSGSEKEKGRQEVLGGGIGGGIAKAVEKNREGGSVPNPFVAMVDRLKPGKNKKVSSEEGRLYLNPIGPIIKQGVKDVTTLAKKGKEVGTDLIRAYAEPLQEQMGRLGGPVSKKVSEEAGQIISRGKELYGELTPIIDPAKKQVGKMMREGTTWMRGRNEVTPFASYNNFFGVNEGAVQTPLNARRGMKMAADANLEIGKLAQRANPGFVASGKLQRIPTTVGYDFIVNGGEGRQRWIEGVAKLNNRPVQEVQRFFDKMKETLGDPSSDAASLDRINQDFVRKFPRTITHVKTPTGWHEVVVSDPFNYLEQATQRTAHSVAFREVYPLIQHNGQWVQSGKLQATRKAIMKELDKGSDIVKFDNLVRALQGHPLDTFKGGATSAIASVSGVFGSPLKALMLSANAPVNIGEVLSGGPSIFMGYTTMGKAVARMIEDKTFYDQLELTGARNKAMYNMSLDPSSPMRSLARQVASGIRHVTGQQFLNEIQETTAAASAKVYADAIKCGKMSKYSLNRANALFRAMGFNGEQANKMVKGDAELLRQFETRAAAWLTTGNQATGEMSRMGASRLFNSIFWFHKYPQMTLNQFRSVGGNLIDDALRYGKNPSKNNWSSVYHNSVLMGTLLGGRALQGAITIATLAAISGGVYGIYQTIREAEEDVMGFVGDSLVSGFGGPLSVLQRLSQNAKGGESFTKEVVKLSAPASLNQELIDMGMGVGRYSGQGKIERIATFLETKTPITKGIKMGLAVAGLSEKDLEFETAVKAFYKWKREQPGYMPPGQMGGTDEQVEFRSGMQKVRKALESGEDWVKELQALKDTKGAGASLRAGTMLQVNGKPLNAEQLDQLRKRLGANGLEKIKLRDAMLREVGRELNEKKDSGEKQKPSEIEKPTGKWAVDYETDAIRKERVMGRLSPKVQEFLKKNEVEEVGYTPSVKRGMKRQQLTMEQVKVLEDEYVSQVEKLVGTLAQNKSLDERTPKLRHTLISNMLEGARKIAMAKSLNKIPRDPKQLEKSK